MFVPMVKGVGIEPAATRKDPLTLASRRVVLQSRLNGVVRVLPLFLLAVLFRSIPEDLLQGVVGLIRNIISSVGLFLEFFCVMRSKPLRLSAVPPSQPRPGVRR